MLIPPDCGVANADELKYVSRYDENTWIKAGEPATHDYVVDRERAMRSYGFRVIGERWAGGYGISPLWAGPVVDSDTQNMLCIRLWEKE